MTHLSDLLKLKVRLAWNAFKRLRERSKVEYYTFILFFVAVGIGLFVFFLASLRFFRAQEPFGPILVDETFYLFNFALLVMLFISSSVSAYNSLFRSGEVLFLLTRPLKWSEIYFVKLAEASWLSSWALLFVALPFMTAYGVVKGSPVYFPFVCAAFYVPFIVLASALGTLTTTLLLALLPDRKKRRAFFTLLLLLAAVFFIKGQQDLLKEQGSVAGILSGYLPHVTMAKNPFLPSAWITRGMVSLSYYGTEKLFHLKEGLFYWLLLFSNMLFVFIPSYLVSRDLFPRIFLSLQDHNTRRPRSSIRHNTWKERFLDRLPWPPKPVMAFFEKDIKTFARDPSEWSQTIIFFGLLVLYFSNLKTLEFHLLQSFWKNMIFLLNTVGTYVVLSSFSMRFIFPMLSLEGSRFWIVDLAPIRYSQLLLEKFVLGTVVSCVLTVPLIFLSGWMLEIPAEKVFYTMGLGLFVCVALTGLSVGLGARFPNFKSTNPAEIISGFGGAVLLLCHMAYLILVGLFLFYASGSYGLTFWIVAAGSLLAGMIPLRVGMTALRKMEF